MKRTTRTFHYSRVIYNRVDFSFVGLVVVIVLVYLLFWGLKCQVTEGETRSYKNVISLSRLVSLKIPVQVEHLPFVLSGTTLVTPRKTLYMVNPQGCLPWDRDSPKSGVSDFEDPDESFRSQLLTIFY